MADPYGLADEGTTTGSFDYRAEFAKLIAAEAEDIERKKKAARDRDDIERSEADRLLEIKEKAAGAAESERKLADAREQQSQQVERVTSGIGLASGALSAFADLLRGNISGALARASQTVSGVIATGQTRQSSLAAHDRAASDTPRKRNEEAPRAVLKGRRTQPASPPFTKLAPTTGKLTDATMAVTGKLTGLASAVGPVGIALAGFTAAIGSVHRALISLGTAASPAAGEALNQSFTLLVSTIGSLVLPYVIYFGAALLFASALLTPVIANLKKDIEASGGILNFGAKKAINALTMHLDVLASLLDKGFRAIAGNALSFAETISKAAAWVLRQLGKLPGGAGFTKQADRLEADARDLRKRFDSNEKSPGKGFLSESLDKVREAIAPVASGAAVGGAATTAAKKAVNLKDDKGRGFGFYLQMMLDSMRILQTRGKGGYESSVAETYRRLQAAVIGTTPIEQQILENIIKNLHESEKIAHNTAKKDTPTSILAP